jgi:glycosyltransferase involved in cell wall biosynthesis
MLPPFPQPPGPATSTPPRTLSIVITNRDYAAYLACALTSALGQRGATVQVIVVDDGSTDGSREILARFGDRVRVILLAGEGQRAAFNAGFAACSGDVVLFLDADDKLHDGTAAAVLAAFAAHPGAARVVFRLEVVDAGGRPTGARLPSARMPLPDGDVRRQVLAFPDDLAWPPTSGNAFATWALRRLLPMPVGSERTGADHHLHSLVGLLGPVVALDRVGGAYRVHGANAHARDHVDVARSRILLHWAYQTYVLVDRLARELGYGPARPRSVTIAAHRLVSLRLGGPGHPIPGDSRRRALGAGLRAACGRVDARPARRAAYAAWFVLASVLPPAGVRVLAEAPLQSLRPGRRARWLTRS